MVLNLLQVLANADSFRQWQSKTTVEVGKKTPLRGDLMRTASIQGLKMSGRKIQREEGMGRGMMLLTYHALALLLSAAPLTTTIGVEAEKFLWTA